MDYGAQNQLVGRVVGIKTGKLMCQVGLEVSARSKMCSVMTIDSMKQLKLKKGDQVLILVKAVNVLLAKDGGSARGRRSRR